VKLIFIKNPQKGKVASFVKVPIIPKAITIYHKEKSFFVISDTKMYKITQEGILSPNPSLNFYTLHSKGFISIFAGNDEKGNEDGVGKRARFNFLSGIAIDQQTGDLFSSDERNHNIRKITPQGKFYDISQMKLPFYLFYFLF
jgi:hypothetical protein